MREINNIGQPLRSPDGSPLGGVRIEWTLSTIGGLDADAIDAISHERYLPVKIYATTSEEDTEELKIGEFKLEKIWPTSRADRQIFYRCRIMADGARPFVAPVMESNVPLKWSDFATSGAPLLPAETSAFAQHLQDFTRHLTALQNAALDNAHSPSDGNPFATIQDVAAAGGAISATDVLYGLTRLATAAANPSDPVVVGDNDGRLHIHNNAVTLNKISEAEELPLWKDGPWPGAAVSSGHTIIDPAGNAKPQRSNLKFDFNIDGSIFAVSVVDHADTDTTTILFTFPAVFAGGNF